MEAWFYALCYSVNGMARKETRAFQVQIHLMIATKWEQPYSKMVRYLSRQIEMLVIQANTMKISGFYSSRRGIPEDWDTAELVAKETRESK